MHIVIILKYALQQLIPLGHSPDEIELIMKESKTHQTSPIQTLNSWNEKIRYTKCF